MLPSVRCHGGCGERDTETTVWVARWQWAVAFHNKISHVRAYLPDFPTLDTIDYKSDIEQELAAVSLQSPSSVFHINKVDFHAHYRLIAGLWGRYPGQWGKPSRDTSHWESWAWSCPSQPNSCCCAVTALYNLAGGSLTQLLFITSDIYTVRLLSLPGWRLQTWDCLALNIGLIDQNLGMRRKIGFKAPSVRQTDLKLKERFHYCASCECSLCCPLCLF